MARDAAGLEWRRAKQLRVKREYAITLRRFEREQQKSERAKQRDAHGLMMDERIIWSINEKWTVGGTGGDVFYIYLLERIPVNDADKVRYVGATNDPRRRYMEHRRCGRLGDADFRMTVVGEIRFPHKAYAKIYNVGSLWSPTDKEKLQAVRKAEKTIAKRYREKGFELINADA